MFALFIVVFVYTPGTNDKIIQSVSVDSTTGFQTEQLCKDAANRYNNKQLLNAFTTADCLFLGSPGK